MRRLREFIEAEVIFALAKNRYHRHGFDIARHKNFTSDDKVPDGCDGTWKNYYERKHPSHYFPDEPHTCPCCLRYRGTFVGSHVIVNDNTYITPICKHCNDKYKGDNAYEHYFYINSEDKVRAPED